MTLRFLRGQVGYMKKLGFEVEIASSPGPELDNFGREEHVGVHAISMERRIAPVKDLVSLYRLWRKIRRLNPEIVHSHTPKGGLLGMCAARLAGVPVCCYHLRGLPMMSAQGKKRELLRWTERLSCALADEVYCVSHSLRDVALAEKLCDAEKIRVLAGGSGNGVDSLTTYNPNSADTASLNKMRAALGIAPDALVIGYVGRLVQDKGIRELVEAWESIRSAIPKLHLLVIGPREAADAVPERTLEVLDTDPEVTWLDMVPSVAPYYGLMDLLVLPTYREGFPNVLLEAAAMEIPVVATRVAGCVDAVLDGVTGTLVSKENAAELADAMTAYLVSEELRDLHGKNARERVVKEFSQERIWQELAKRYEFQREQVDGALAPLEQGRS